MGACDSLHPKEQELLKPSLVNLDARVLAVLRENFALTKKKTISLKRLLQILALLLFVANWFSSANASFLCVCSDGHTAIENIYSSECHQADFRDYDNTTMQLRTQHDCEDVSLSSSSINSSFNHFKNVQVQQTQILNNFIQTNIVSLVQDQSYLSVPLIRTDNKLRLFTDSIRLII